MERDFWHSAIYREVSQLLKKKKRNKNEQRFLVNRRTELGTQGNTPFLKKIPAGAEASNVLVGEVDFLDKPVSAFIRLTSAVILGDLTEVPVPTRFIFILLGPVVRWPIGFVLFCIWLVFLLRSKDIAVTHVPYPRTTNFVVFMNALLNNHH